MQNYKQADTRWGAKPYAGDTMAGSGCGPTATANIIEKDPWTIACWMTNHGYASNGSGTYWGGIPAALNAYDLSAKQLNYSSLYGVSGSTIETKWKSAIQSGNYVGILLMGAGKFTSGGHYITITKYSNGQYYVHDPASAARDGWHPWADFNKNVKVFYLAKKTSSNIPTNTDSSSSSWKAVGTATCTDNDVNVRSTSTSSTSSNIMGQLNAGQRFEVDGIVTNGWVHVKVSGIGIGYIYQDYVRYDGLPATPHTSSTSSNTSNTTTTSYAFSVKTIQMGSSGNGVLLLQEILKSRGLYTGALDKMFGSLTDTAVKKYQTLRNMSVDGICGSATWADLLALPTK